MLAILLLISRVIELWKIIQEDNVKRLQYYGSQLIKVETTATNNDQLQLSPLSFYAFEANFSTKKKGKSDPP